MKEFSWAFLSPTQGHWGQRKIITRSNWLHCAPHIVSGYHLTHLTHCRSLSALDQSHPLQKCSLQEWTWSCHSHTAQLERQRAQCLPKGPQFCFDIHGLTRRKYLLVIVRYPTYTGCSEVAREDFIQHHLAGVIADNVCQAWSLNFMSIGRELTSVCSCSRSPLQRQQNATYLRATTENGRLHWQRRSVSSCDLICSLCRGCWRITGYPRSRSFFNMYSSWCSRSDVMNRRDQIWFAMTYCHFLMIVAYRANLRGSMPFPS